MRYLRRFLIVCLLVLLFALCSFAQNTTVSGTITDTPDGQAWFGGTFSFVFRVSPSNPTAQYFFNGAPFSSAQTIAGALDGSGHYSQGVPPNTSITPAGSTWDATFCPLATAQCVTYQSVTITGATQTFSPSPPSIRINLAVPLQNPRAYTDTEIVNGALGQTYFNLISTFARICSVFPCGWTNSGSGGSSITLKTNGTTNPVQSLLNIIGGTAITATADGSGGVTVASTIGPPCNTLGVFQAGNGTGGYNCTNVSESGSVLTNQDNNSNRGPNPAVDITAPPFNARAVSTSVIPSTTGTITGGTNSLSVASATGWQKNDGLALIGGGATNCATAPSAPTVTPSLASAMTGTGHAVPGDTGSTSYSYVVIAISQGGCYTAASAIGSTSTGNATLGATNIPITSCANVAGTVTCTVGNTATLATGMWVRMGGSTDDTEFGGRHNITVLNGTQFTYTSNENSTYPMTSTTATGGTLYYWVENLISLPALPVGTNIYKEALYRCTGASCALPANAANYSLIYVSYPLTLGYIDSGYGKVDDYGTISTVTIGQSADWFIPSTPPASNINDMLVTTVTNISGTTFTLAANASNTVTNTSCNGGTCSVRFDDAPAISLAESTSNNTGSGGGGAVHLPPPALSGISGPACYVTSSYLVLSSIINAGNYLCPGVTLELSGQRGALFGTYENTISSITSTFAMQTASELLCLGANPCIWRKGPTIKNLYLNTLGPGQLMIFDTSAINPTLTENVYISVPDGMGINYYSYAQGFGGMFRNFTLTSGPGQVIGVIDTPSFIDKDNNQLAFDYLNGSSRGIFYECTNNPPNGCANYISLKMGEEWQGPITPLLTINSLSGARFGWIYMEHIIQDSGAEPIFANAGGANLASLVINGTNGPGKDPGAGNNQPIISGNQLFGGVSLLISAPLLASATGINHDITMCSGQAASNQAGYTGCALPSLNLATTSYAVSHTLNASEGIVKASASGITFTLPHAIAGQTWEILNPSSGPITLTIDSGTLSGNGSTGPITISANQGVLASCDGANCSAFGGGGGGGGGCSPGGITDALQYNGGGPCSFGGVNSPTVNGNYVVNYNVTASAAVPPTINLPGVPINPQTGTTYIEGSANTQSDRFFLITASNAGAQTYTPGNPSAAGFGFNYGNALDVIGPGAVTETASGFSINGVSNASFVTPASWLRWWWTDGVNARAEAVPTARAFPACLDTGGNHYNKDANGNLICGTSASGNGLSGMTAGQVPIAASATSVTSSEALAGAGAAITTGPATSTSLDVVEFTGTGGQIADTGVLFSNVWRKDAANISLSVNHDFSAGTWKIPAAAGFTAGATSNFGLDTTAKLFHCYLNNADAVCSALSTISPAVTSNTIANANNPQTWNWAQTSNNQNGITFGETSAATGGTLTGNNANQAEVSISTASASTATPLSITQGSVTGSVAFPAVQIQTTWNNASLSGQGLQVACTNTSSAAGSHCLNVLSGAAGNTSEFSVDPNGNVNVSVGILQLASLSRGNCTTCGVVYQGGLDGGGATVGSGGFRGSDNTSVAVGAIAGAATLRAGDMTTGTANQTLGGILTIRGGNTPSTASNATGGAVSITGGGLTGAVTNGVGADTTIQGGLGTGTGTPSHVIIKTPGFGAASGTTAQANVTRSVVHAKAGSTTSGTATNMFNIALANNQTAMARVVVHVETTQATPHNCSTGSEFFVVAQDTAGTVTTNVSAAVGLATICDTGTLTLTLGASGAAPTVISVTPSWTTIVPTAVIITVEVENLSQQDVSLL